ncbi:MAG: GntR family transcriptional regulator [Parvularculaceae bacterium]
MSLAIHDTKLPRYLQVYSIIKDWIQNGRYSPNEKLPSEGEFCKILGVSRITTRRAIEMLTQEGLLHRVQGLGTFVCATTPKGAKPSSNISDLSERVKRLSERTRLESITIEVITPNARIRNELELGENEKCQKVSYTRVEKKAPIGYADIYFPEDLGVEITEDVILQDSTPTLLQNSGVSISGAHQLIGAELADEQSARRLKISVGTPLVRIRLLILDKKKRPVEYLHARYRADVYEHHAYLTSL